MSESNKQIDYQYLTHPNYPVAILEFLKEELKISNKYVIAAIETGTSKLCRLLVKHVHLVCAVEPNPNTLDFINQQFTKQKNFIGLQGSYAATRLDNDAIDGVLIGQSFAHWDTDAARKELERILRLNSYVCILTHHLLPDNTHFLHAYSQFVQQFMTTQQDDYAQVLDKERLTNFYPDGYEERVFPNQQRFTLESLQQYYTSSVGALDKSHPKYELALKALRMLFQQYQQHGEVVLSYETHLYFGLFNKNVPAISLRKSIFFQLLRPFAFMFYVMVKCNIYFWRFLYRIKDWVIPKK